MQDSIFTKIIKGEIPCHKVYEDDKTIAILDIHPINQGHTLVIPKEQVSHFDELDENLFLHVMKIVRLVAKRQKEIIKPPRIGLLVAGFDVPHAHIHVFPAYKGSDVPSAQDMSVEPNHEELSELANKLRSNVIN